MSKDNAISISDLFVSYGMTPAIEDVSLNIKENDFIAILGPNGGGKTTLVKSLLGLIDRDSGDIKIFNKLLNYDKNDISYVPQFSTSDRTFPMHVLDLVLLGGLPSKTKWFQKFNTQDIEKAMKILKIMHIDHLSQRQIAQMSGGEYQKALIARAMMSDPKILVLDEPTSNVDQRSRIEIYELLSMLKERMTIIMITHDQIALSSHINRIVYLDKSIKFDGDIQGFYKFTQSLYQSSKKIYKNLGDVHA